VGKERNLKTEMAHFRGIFAKR